MNEDVMSIVMIAAVLAFVAAVVATLIVIIRYKKKLKSPIYPVNKYANLSLNIVTDDFIGKTISAVKISSESNKR